MVDTAQWNLLGHVRSVRSEVAEWDRERGAWNGRRFFRTAVFDAGGRLTQMDQRGPHESIHRIDYRYDGQGRQFEESSGVVGQPAAFRRRWSYDGQGREAAISIVHGDGAEERWQESTYDERGLRTDRILFGMRHDTDACAYGVKGSEFAYGARTAISQVTRYDGSGQPVDVEFFDPGGSVVRRVRMTRDSHGRVLVEDTETPSAMPFERKPGMSDAQFETMRALMTAAVQTVYEYNSEGRTLTRVQRMGLLGENRTSYRYDERGNPLEQSEVRVQREMSVDEAGVPHAEPETTRIHDVRFAYVYDAHGNWTEQIVSARHAVDGALTPTNAEWRTIEYGE